MKATVIERTPEMGLTPVGQRDPITAHFGLKKNKAHFLGRILAVLTLAAVGLSGLSSAADLSPKSSFALERTAGDIVFNPSLQWLVVNQTDGSVAVWDVTKGVRAGSWSGNGSIAFASRTNLLLAAGRELTVRELLTGKVSRRLESPAYSVGSLDVATSGSVAVAPAGGLVFWNLADGRIIRGLPTTPYPWNSGMRNGMVPLLLPIWMSVGFCRAVSPDGSRFAVGQSSAQVDVWTLAGSSYIHYLGTDPGPGEHGMMTSVVADVLAFLDNQRLAVVYNHQQLSVLTLNTNDAGLVQNLPRVSFTAKTPDGETVAGELVAPEKYQATIQIQQLGLMPVSVTLPSDGLKNYIYQHTNAIGWPVAGRVTATNIADASAQFKKSHLEGGRILEAPDDAVTVQSRKRASQERLKQSPNLALVQKRQALIGNPGFEIRSLAVSQDGRRLAVAGMRMAWRRGVFAPAGDGVYDVPVNAEIQVWNAIEMKLLATVKGRPDEKFANVALDEAGRRIAAVTTGAAYTSKMSGAEQQGIERAQPSSRRVYLWELPVETEPADSNNRPGTVK